MAEKNKKIRSPGGERRGHTWETRITEKDRKKRKKQIRNDDEIRNEEKRKKIRHKRERKNK